MKAYKKYISKNKYFLSFLLIYIFLRIIFININFTEWGDAFRFIRGADFLSRFDWPFDEKRLPFYSLLIVPGIWINAPVMWGRLLAIFINIGIFFITYYFYLNHISKNRLYALFSVMFLATTPVFSYWSFRVMADVFFALLVIVVSYLVLNLYKDGKKKVIISNNFGIKLAYLISASLLATTMTRFEGAFLAFGVGIFLLLERKIKDIFIIFIPQVLIFVPWFVYSKLLYQGEKQQNNYFDEVQTFVFDLDRFIYFFIYTFFILVAPFMVFFVLFGIKKFINSNSRKVLINYVPILIFIALEFAIGFIWTPSLPRIYIPIIPFLILLGSYGIEKFEFGKFKWLIILIFIILVGIFLSVQLNSRFYFLGASKIAMFSIVGFSSLMIISMSFIKKWKILTVLGLLGINIAVSFVVIANESSAYKSLKLGIDYITENLIVEDKNVLVAYSDETGNTTWYLREYSIRPEFDKDLGYDSQYKYLIENNVDYMLWTNEFNRGSSFKDPIKDDEFTTRYELLASYEDPAAGVFAKMMDSLDIKELEGYFVFRTKVYKVIYDEK